DPVAGRLPAGIDGPARLVEVDEQRGVIRWHRLALARLAVDLGEDDAFRDRRAHEQVVDPHPEVLVEVAGPVVPPREAAGFRVARAVAVDEARLEEPLEGGPFRWRNVGPAVSGLGVPYVGVRGRDVEVAADDQVR